MAAASFADRFLEWAQDRADIRGALLIGSQARHVQPADEWSDYDLVVVTTQPDSLLEDATWLAALGTPLLTVIEKAAAADLMERRVLFDDGLDVDFIPVPVERFQALLAEGTASEVWGILGRGFRLLLDKDGWAPLLRGYSVPSPSEVLAADIDTAVEDFWYHAIWAAKKLRRGEIWVAKACCDVYLKKLLLQVIEWHARAAHGCEYDIWFGGRFLERWVDPAVAVRLRRVFALYDKDSVRSALKETADLFDSLVEELAKQLGYQRIGVVERRARGIFEQILETDTLAP